MTHHDSNHATRTTPAIILLRPQLGDNIGAVARAMSNFGLSELRLSAPKNGWPNARAYEFATDHAKPILDGVSLHETTAGSLTGIHAAYAYTARPRDMEKRVVTPEQAAAEMHALTAEGKRVALLFGPERTGMENDDIVYADAIVTIPTAPENPSLNLAQSAVIALYAWQSAKGEAFTRAAQSRSLAPREELEAFFTQLETYLDDLNYFRTADKKPAMWQNLRNIFVRSQLNDQEVRTLRGLMRDLYKRRRVGGDGSMVG